MPSDVTEVDGLNMEKFLLISAGALLGANARYWISDWAARKWGATFPIGTMLVNLTGSLLLGIFVSMATERLNLDPRWRLLIAVGFLGSYTTFSTYTYESLNMLSKGEWVAGLLNLLGSTVLGIAAIAIGFMIGKSL